jgi:glycosyltransferase involved in cell wall biosynthesis
VKNKTIKSLYISYNAITEPIVQSQVIPYLKGLSKRGIKFYLLTFEKKRMKKEEKSKIRQMLKKQSDNDSDISWFCLDYHKRPTIPATAFDIFLGCIYSLYIMVRNRIDVVHARAIVAALAGCPAAKILSKKFIFDTRGIDSEEYIDGDLWRRGGLEHKIAGFLEGVLTKVSSHVVVLTDRFLEILKEKYRGKKIEFSVIPCAVDTDRFKPERTSDNNAGLRKKMGIQDKFIIVYAGSLGTWYMLSEMIDFFKTAVKLIENAHFLILTQSDKTYAIDLVKTENLDIERVTISEAPSASMPDYLSFCDMGIFFIKPVFSKLSSSPVKLAEYLSSGLPVVINSGIGDTDRLVKRYGVGAVVGQFNEESYKKAIGSITRMLEKRSVLKTRCREAAQKELSLKMATERYYKIYEELAK